MELNVGQQRNEKTQNYMLKNVHTKRDIGQESSRRHIRENLHVAPKRKSKNVVSILLGAQICT